MEKSKNKNKAKNKKKKTHTQKKKKRGLQGVLLRDGSKHDFFQVMLPEMGQQLRSNTSKKTEPSTLKVALLPSGVLLVIGTLMVIGNYQDHGPGSPSSLHWILLLGDTCAPGRRLTKLQTTSRPENTRPEVWSNMSKRSRQEEKPKLKAIDYIDPEDIEVKEPTKIVREKLEVHMDSEIPCKMRKT